MRRMWAFTIAGAFLAFGAMEADAQIHIGAKGGISFSDVSLEPDEDTESITGFVGGGEVRFPLGASGLWIQPEILYVRKGAEQTEGGFTSELKVDYVEIPLLVRFNIPAQAVSPFVYAGGAVAFEASCTLEETDGTVTLEADCEDGGLDTESTDFGVLFGGGLAFAAGPGDVFVEGRYNIGLVDVAAEEGVEVKNRSGAVMIGYSVSLDPTR